MVRVFVSRLGVDDLTATIAGVIYGAYGALTLLTIWASTAGGGFAVACALGAMVLLLDGLTPRSRRRRRSPVPRRAVRTRGIGDSTRADDRRAPGPEDRSSLDRDAHPRRRAQDRCLCG